MGMLPDEGSKYLVFADTAGDPIMDEVAGTRAFSEANRRFEELKADPAVGYVFLARWDGHGWQLVAGPLRRGPGGEWAPDPFATPPPPPGPGGEGASGGSVPGVLW